MRNKTYTRPRGKIKRPYVVPETELTPDEIKAHEARIKYVHEHGGKYTYLNYKEEEAEE